MLSRKQVNLFFFVIVVLISAIVIILSDDSPKFTSPFNNTQPTQIPEQGENTLGVYSTKAPLINSASEDSLTIAEGSESIIEGYKVVKVIDGDTLDVDIDGKVERLRLIGIDTPETVDPRKSVQCFGIEASNNAKEILSGLLVTLESDDSQGERDKYKRLLRYVFLPDGANFNQVMIEEGYAYEYTYDQEYKYQSEFKQAQLDAQSQNKGLWNPSTCSGVR